jgi:hypothetical protein
VGLIGRGIDASAPFADHGDIYKAGGHRVTGPAPAPRRNP